MTFTLGFKALAYPASSLSNSHPVSPCPCSLAFRCDAAAEQATVLLVATIPTAQGPQTFVVQCDADKLRSASLCRSNSYIPQPQLDGLLRDKDNKRSDVKTLALDFDRPCPLWCARSEAFGPEAGAEQPFQQLVSLTKATAIHVVFDYKFVTKPYQDMFRAFGKAADGLRGFPVDRLLATRGLRRASWEVFGPSNADEAPPAYENARKRARQSSSASPRQAPKRFAPQSPTESHASDRTVPLSPATADAIQKALGASPAFDYQTEAISVALARHLPAALKEALPSVLHEIMPTLLHGILPTLFAGSPPPSIRSTPHTSFNRARSKTPRSSPFRSSPPKSPRSTLTSSQHSSPNRPPKDKPPTLSPLAQTLLPHLSSHLTAQLTTHHRRLLTRFTTRLNTATDHLAHESALLLDDLEEAKTDLALLREDAISELLKESSAVLERGREEAVQLADEVGERLERVWGEACERVDRVGKWGVKRMVGREVGRWMRVRGQKGIRKGMRRGIGARRERGGIKLLERRREGEGEWEDVDDFYDSDDLDNL